MTNVHPFRNSTPEQRAKEAIDKLLKGETDFENNNRDQWLNYGAALNEMKAQHGGNDKAFGQAVSAAGLDKWPEDVLGQVGHVEIHPKVRQAAMWAADLEAKGELATIEAAHPHIKVTRDGGFRGLHAAHKGKPDKEFSTKIRERVSKYLRPKIEAGENVTVTESAKDLGISELPVREVMAYEKGRVAAKKEMSAEIVIDVSTLSMSAQERLEAAKRQEIKKMRDEFDKLVRAQVSEEIDNIIQNRLVSIYQKKFDHAEKVVASYKGSMTKKEYNMVRSCLHPDSRASVSADRLAEAFNVFSNAEIALLPAVDTAPDCPTAPADLSEYLKRKD